jgi:predicted AAA+ superfamily ATPase
VKDHSDTGKLLENQVFIDLLRANGQKPRFFRTTSDGEIDFVTSSRLVQVCAELSDENRAREEAPLRSEGVATRFPGWSGDVVTLDRYPNGVAFGTGQRLSTAIILENTGRADGLTLTLCINSYKVPI